MLSGASVTQAVAVEKQAFSHCRLCLTLLPLSHCCLFLIASSVTHCCLYLTLQLLPQRENPPSRWGNYCCKSSISIFNKSSLNYDHLTFHKKTKNLIHMHIRNSTAAIWLYDVRYMWHIYFVHQQLHPSQLLQSCQRWRVCPETLESQLSPAGNQVAMKSCWSTTPWTHYYLQCHY